MSARSAPMFRQGDCIAYRCGSAEVRAVVLGVGTHGMYVSFEDSNRVQWIGFGHTDWLDGIQIVAEGLSITTNPE